MSAAGEGGAPPEPPTSILIVPLGPRFVFMTSRSPLAALMFMNSAPEAPMTSALGFSVLRDVMTAGRAQAPTPYGRWQCLETYFCTLKVSRSQDMCQNSNGQVSNSWFGGKPSIRLPIGDANWHRSLLVTPQPPRCKQPDSDRPFQEKM